MQIKKVDQHCENSVKHEMRYENNTIHGDATAFAQATH